MEIPKWVPKEGAEYLVWYHRLLTRVADCHPEDEHHLRLKIKIVERIACSEDMMIDAIDPLKKMGFQNWRDFYAIAVNRCLSATEGMIYRLPVPPNEYRRELQRFSKTVLDLVSIWQRLCIGGIGYAENCVLEDSYGLVNELLALAAEVEEVNGNPIALFGGFRVGHYQNLFRDEAASSLCKYLKKEMGKPCYRVVAAVLRTSQLDCAATEETVRSIWRRRAQLTGENLPQNS